MTILFIRCKVIVFFSKRVSKSKYVWWGSIKKRFYDIQCTSIHCLRTSFLKVTNRIT